jgi:ABC-2 type transport system ATP-binding protein
MGGTERKRCEELSKGMTQKVQFIAATIHAPDLLILDEPFSGLDPVSAKLLREMVLAEHQRGATVLFSTHVMPHAEEICDRVVMIHQGRKVLDEQVAAIRSRYDLRSIQFEPLDPAADISTLQALPEVERVDRREKSYQIQLIEGTRPSDAMRRIIQTVVPARIELSRPRLEDVFIKLVSDGTATGETAENLRSQLSNSDAKAAAV